MRISEITQTKTYLTSINNTKKEIQKLQTQISTQSMVNKPSDSPSGTAKILRLNEYLKSNETYVKNIENGISFLDTTIFTMENIQNELQNTEVLFARIVNPENDTNLIVFADQVKYALDNIIKLANSNFDGRYLFGGTDFSTTPYGYNNDGSAVEQKIPDASGEHKIKISSDVTQKINITGKEIFGDIDGNDIFNILKTIEENLRNGIKPSAEQVDAVKKINVNVLNQLTSAGNIMNRLIDTEEMLGNQTIELKNLLSKEKDTDIATAVIDLQSHQYSLELSYKMSSLILPKSLLDYL